jgi:hypothetical protein
MRARPLRGDHRIAEPIEGVRKALWGRREIADPQHREKERDRETQEVAREHGSRKAEVGSVPATPLRPALPKKRGRE